MNENLILVFGNFNIVHPGHLRLLRYAKSFNKKVIVGLFSDNIAGDAIYVPQNLRSEALLATEWVDEVIIVDHSVEDIILELKPFAVIKGKEKVSTKGAINKYFNSNHFKDLSKGSPYDHFIDGLNDKCLIKLIDSPMKDKETDDEVIKELQKKLKELSNEELKDTFWEIETGEFVNSDQIKELELERDQMIESLDLKNEDNVHKVLIDFCKKYEELCIVKYPDAPLPLEILKSTGS